MFFGPLHVMATGVHSLPTVIHSPNTPKLTVVQARCQHCMKDGQQSQRWPLLSGELEMGACLGRGPAGEEQS